MLTKHTSQIHLVIREGFSCLNASSVFVGEGLDSFISFMFFLRFFFAVLHSSPPPPRAVIPLTDPFGASVLGAVDFHLAIKQPFAINFHTTSTKCLEW